MPGFVRMQCLAPPALTHCQINLVGAMARDRHAIDNALVRQLDSTAFMRVSAARMESASTWRRHYRRHLARDDLLAACHGRIRYGNGVDQCPGVWMQGAREQAGAAVTMGFLKQNGDVYEMEAAYKKGLLTINGAPMPIPLLGVQ